MRPILEDAPRGEPIVGSSLPVSLPRAEDAPSRIRRVMVPVDGSDFSEHALAWALEIAHRTGGRLDVVMVHVDPPHGVLGELPSSQLWHEEARNREARYVENLADGLAYTDRVLAESTLLEGKSVSRELARFTRDRAVDLVVMTTHGRSGAERAWLGSVAEALIRRVTVPVLLVRPERATRGLHRRDALFRRVLVALDGSNLAERALEAAAVLGSMDGATFELVQAIDPLPVAVSIYLPHTVELVEDAVEAEAERAGAYLERVRRALQHKGYDASTLVISDAEPARAILRHAEASGAHLIALGTHGRRGLGRVVLGSVADTVLRGASCPVLIVPKRSGGAAA